MSGEPVPAIEVQDLRKSFGELAVLRGVSFAAEAADRIIFLDEGRGLEEAPPLQFLHNCRHERSRRFLEQFLSRSSAFPSAPAPPPTGES